MVRPAADRHAGRRAGPLVAEKLPFEKFGIFLNAGHLIHLDEWLSSPIYPGSEVPLHSGMVMQVDVIPSSRVYSSTRMEDGVVMADETCADASRRCSPTASPAARSGGTS